MKMDIEGYELTAVRGAARLQGRRTDISRSL
jgi:hypothetical protein